MRQCDGSSISWQGGASEREWGVGDSRLSHWLGHPGDPQDWVGDTGAVDQHTIHLNDILAEVAAAVVVLVGTHCRDWLGGVGMCVGRVGDCGE